MTSVLLTLLGDGHSAISEACRSGDALTAEYVLRIGGAPDARDSSGPVTLSSPTEPQVWARLGRLSRVPDAPQSNELVNAFLSGLHRIGGSWLLRVTSSDEGQQVHLGFASTDALDWAQRSLAPNIMLAADDPGDPSTGDARYAVRFRQAPGGLASPPEGRTAQPPLLERLASVPGRWTVTVSSWPRSGADVQHAIVALGELHRDTASMMTATRAVDESTSIQATDPAAQRVIEWLTVFREDLSRMLSTGAWSTEIEVIAGDWVTAAQAAAATGAIGLQFSGAQPRNWLADTFEVGAAGRDLRTAASVVDSNQLATFLLPPRATRGSVDVGPPLPADRRNLTGKRGIWLGAWAGTQEKAVLDIADLAGHAFIAGVTGSGKSTTVNRVVLGSWNQFGVPFLIVDPVKTDYDVLASTTRGGLLVLAGADLRFNVLRPQPGFDVATHLDYISAAFKGAFSMPSPVPYVTTLLFDEMRDRVVAGEQVTLHDLRLAVRPLVERLGYKGDLEANILASLGVRLSVLCAPSRAERLCSEEFLPDIFSRPVVITLSDIGDDEERAFLMAALTISIAEHAKLRGDVDDVVHLTILEEAHRMVGEPGGSTGEEGNAAGHSARLLTQLLAEIRSTGESIVLLDQSPAAVARDVVRNTNTKIVHRTLDPADRELLGGAMGLELTETAFLSGLVPGQAAISTARLARPQLLQVERPFRPVSGTAVVDKLPYVGRPCCGTDAPAHHRAREYSEQAAQVVLEAMTAVLVGRGAVSARADAVQGRLERIAVRSSGVAASCLLRIGAQLGADAWCREGWLTAVDAAALAGLLTRAFQPRGAGLAFSDLPLVSSPSARPYRGCAGCGHACSVRPIARNHPSLSRIRSAVANKAPDQVAGTLSTWKDHIAAGLIDVIGVHAASDAGRCVVVHALDDDSPIE